MDFSQFGMFGNGPMPQVPPQMPGMGSLPGPQLTPQAQPPMQMPPVQAAPQPAVQPPQQHPTLQSFLQNLMQSYGHVQQMNAPGGSLGMVGPAAQQQNPAMIRMQMIQHILQNLHKLPTPNSGGVSAGY